MLTGAKFSEVNAKNVFDRYDANGSVNVIDINLSNTFDYREQISAGYLKYETPINDALSFDLGVRLENTHSEGNLLPTAGSSQSATSVVRSYLLVIVMH
jgi:outer membrane receptor protein involved in Fe transport